MEGLYIHKGYWRATNTSTNVNKCFNSKACLGGITGTFDYCLPGYEGPCKHSLSRDEEYTMRYYSSCCRPHTSRTDSPTEALPYYTCLRMVACNMTLPLSYVPRRLFADCSVCSKNHVSSLSFTCRECFDSAVVILTATVFTILVAAVALATFSYLVSVKGVDAGRGIMDCVTQRIPMHSVKIIIVVWQILTQVRASNRCRARSAKL